MYKSQLCQGGINDKWRKLYEKLTGTKQIFLSSENLYYKKRTLCCSSRQEGVIVKALQQSMKQEEKNGGKF